ncbi:MAG TPA: metalloregulator ArsR/SmtB family transcription factor [Euzebyales bacterium]
MQQHATLRPPPGTDHELVAAVLRDQPDDDQIGRLADVFALLGDPGRLRLLAALLSSDELCVTDLAVVSGLSESATSHALRLLRAHTVVRARRVGRHVHYSLRDGHVRTLLATAIDHVTHDRG